jgi:hypothetical protein
MGFILKNYARNSLPFSVQQHEPDDYADTGFKGCASLQSSRIALAAHRLSLHTNVFRICSRSHRTVWRDPRNLARVQPPLAVSSAASWRIRSFDIESCHT